MCGGTHTPLTPAAQIVPPPPPPIFPSQVDQGIGVFKASGNAPEVGAYLAYLMGSLETANTTLPLPSKEDGKVGQCGRPPTPRGGDGPGRAARTAM